MPYNSIKNLVIITEILLWGEGGRGLASAATNLILVEGKDQCL